MSAYRGKADIVHIPTSAGTSALDYCLAEPDRVFCLKLGLGAFRWATKLYWITPITLTGGTWRDRRWRIDRSLMTQSGHRGVENPAVQQHEACYSFHSG